eukprot:jgi/Botrbrau1/23039/Bobra.136_1s0028.1
MHVAMQAQDNPKPVTFANLLTWALDSDAEFAATLLRQKRTNSAQGAKVNNSQGDQNDKKNFHDNRSSQYRGRGRGNGRGYANYNQPFEEKSPFSFMLQLNMDEEDSDLDVNICDLTPDDQTDTDREDQVSARDPDFMPVKIENRKPAIYVPSQAPVRKRKRTVTASTPQQAEKTVSDVLPCPPTPVGEQFPKLDLSCLSNLRTNKSAPKSPPVRKVIRKSRAASKTGPASKTPAGLPPLIARGRKPRHTKQVQAMIKEGMELLAGAYEFIDRAAASKSIDKGKRPMTPAECAAFESSQKSSGKPQLPQLPVPMERQEVTFLPRVEPPPHATAFRNVPLYTDDCWKLPLPDSTRVAERQKDLCWPMRAALFDPTLHCFEKPPYWPAHLPKPAQHTGWPSGPNIEPAQVYYDNGMVKPFIDFVPVLQHPPNTLNETHMARFNAEYMNTLEPIWQRTPNTDEYIAVDASVLPTHRMITTRTVQHNRSVVTTVSPQIQLTNEHLDILALVQDSHDLNPRFMNWSVDIHDLLQQKAMNPPPAQHVGAQMTPIETKKDIALRALALRHNHASDLLQQAREITGFQPDRYAGPSSMSETPPVSQPSTVVHDFDDLRNVMCGMMQGLGPMSGTSHENPPANVFALNSRRPYRAENFRPADRADPRPAQHPPQYFHQPENRIASAVITTTLSGLVRITKNPAYPKFADACEALFQPSPVDAEKVIVEMGVALNHMAEQEQIAFSCSLNGRELPLQGGEMFMQDAGTATPHTTFETPLYREPSLYIPSRGINFEEIPIISLLTPAMQIAESVP